MTKPGEARLHNQIAKTTRTTTLSIVADAKTKKRKCSQTHIKEQRTKHFMMRESQTEIRGRKSMIAGRQKMTTTETLSNKIEDILKNHAPSSFLNDNDAHLHLLSLLIDDCESTRKERKDYAHSLLEEFLSSCSNNDENENNKANNSASIITKLLFDEFDKCHDDDNSANDAGNNAIDGTANKSNNLRMGNEKTIMLPKEEKIDESDSSLISSPEANKEKSMTIKILIIHIDNSHSITCCKINSYSIARYETLITHI